VKQKALGHANFKLAETEFVTGYNYLLAVLSIVANFTRLAYEKS
jgi:hypothetical protein